MLGEDRTLSQQRTYTVAASSRSRQILVDYAPISIKSYPAIALLSPGSGYVESTLVALRTTTGLL